MQAGFANKCVTTLVPGTKPELVSSLRRLERKCPIQWLVKVASSFWTTADSCTVYLAGRELVHTCHPYNTVALLYKAAYKLIKHYYSDFSSALHLTLLDLSLILPFSPA